MSNTSSTPGRLDQMQPCYWGSVNQWECDENNHLNVRFYAHKATQAIQVLVSQMSNGALPDVPAAVRTQHIRFLNESRAATPLRVDAAVIAREPDHLVVLSLMYDNISGSLLAAFQTRLETSQWHAVRPEPAALDVPEAARPLGIDPLRLPPPPEDVDRARKAGYRTVGRGVIEHQECDPNGQLMPHGYIGRVSDGMPNLWALLNPPAEQSAHRGGELGGAALEQRVEILAPLRTGSVFTHLSGVRSLGNKTQHMTHLLYDETCQRMAAAVEAVGVAMDLTSRRAVPISRERRRHLEGLMIR